MASPRIAELIEEGAACLRVLRDPRLDAELLLRDIAGLDRAAILGHPDRTLDAETVERFRGAVERRARHEPVQYILGHTAFWRDDFRVTPAVLIPRPETEVLVEVVAIALRSRPSPRILDVGTGSGCIGLSLLRELPTAALLAIDSSSEALAVAAENARRLDLAGRATFIQSSWFASVDESAGFDAIVSNPPYVDVKDASTLSSEVRAHEPHLALFAEPDDDLSSYRSIIAGMGARLKPGGLLCFEVGLGQADRVARLLREHGFDEIATTPDLAGIPRVVTASR